MSIPISTVRFSTLVFLATTFVFLGYFEKFKVLGEDSNTKSLKEETEEEREGMIEKKTERGQSVKLTSLLNPQQIKEFCERGVLVVKNILSSDEIIKSREGE
jgi:hypothetical protein